MKKLKRLFALMIAVTFVFALAGCEQAAPSSSTGTTSSTSGTSTTGTTSTQPQTTSTGNLTNLDGEEVTVSNSGSAGAGTNTAGAGSALAQKIAQIAATFPSRYSSGGSFPYAPETRGGELGCAQVVSHVLREAGVSAYSLGCYDLRSQLQGQGWTRVSPPPQPGDVIVWSPLRRGGHPHIGVAVRNGNSIMAMNNSSGLRKPVLSGWNSRGVETILRKA